MEIVTDNENILAVAEGWGSRLGAAALLFMIGAFFMAWFYYSPAGDQAFRVLLAIVPVLLGMALISFGKTTRIVVDRGAGAITVIKDSLLGSEKTFIQLKDVKSISFGVLPLPSNTGGIGSLAHLDVLLRDGRTKKFYYTVGKEIEREGWIAGKIAKMAGVKA